MKFQLNKGGLRFCAFQGKMMVIAIIVCMSPRDARAADIQNCTLFGTGWGTSYTSAFDAATNAIANQVASLDAYYLAYGYEKTFEETVWEDSGEIFPGYWVCELTAVVTYAKKGWKILAPDGAIATKTFEFKVERPKKGMAYLRLYHFNAAGEFIVVGPPDWGVMPTGMVEVPGADVDWTKNFDRPGRFPAGTNFRLDLITKDAEGNETVVDRTEIFSWNGKN